MKDTIPFLTTEQADYIRSQQEKALAVVRLVDSRSQIGENLPKWHCHCAEEVISQLQAALRCTEYEARYFYYNNAVSFVKEVAVKKTKTARTISRKRFLEAIGIKRNLFDKWYIEYIGHDKYFQAARK